MAVSGISEQFERQQGAYGAPRRDHFRPGEVGTLDEFIKRNLSQSGEEKEHAAEFGAEMTRCQVELPDVCNGGCLGTRELRAFFVLPPGKTRKAFFAENG